MKHSLVSRVITAVALFAFSTTPRAGAQTPGKATLVIASVSDGQSGAPLADAQVSLSDLNVSARTDWSGEARIPNVSPGQHKFEIRRAGYARIIIPSHKLRARSAPSLA